MHVACLEWQRVLALCPLVCLGLRQGYGCEGTRLVSFVALAPAAHPIRPRSHPPFSLSPSTFNDRLTFLHCASLASAPANNFLNSSCLASNLRSHILPLKACPLRPAYGPTFASPTASSTADPLTCALPVSLCAAATGVGLAAGAGGRMSCERPSAATSLRSAFWRRAEYLGAVQERALGDLVGRKGLGVEDEGVGKEGGISEVREAGDSRWRKGIRSEERGLIFRMIEGVYLSDMADK